MKTAVASAALGLLALPFAAAKVSYDGYKAFHINSGHSHDDIAKSLEQLDFISLECEGSHQGFDIAVAPQSVAAFEKLGLDFKVVHEDLGADIAAEATFTPYISSTKNAAGTASLPDISYFDSYHDYDTHIQFLEDLQAAFPNNSDIFVAGQSYEDRPIQGIHLYGADGPGTKPAIVWHGTVHAREWIVTPTVEYMTYKLIQGYQNGDATPKATLDNYDFYILPVVNPDGFVFTQTENRLWRKNVQVRSGTSCAGTDINRNWPYKWDVSGGSSPYPCEPTYRGEAPGDTPENQALVNHTLSVSENAGLKLFIDWHAYSQYILLPYGYSCSAEADNIDKQMDLAGAVAEAIRGVNGLDFIYGPTCSTIYQTAGGSNDWAADIAGAELAWAVELRPTPTGSGGFVLSPDNILPSGEEMWAGMLSLFSSF